jgi:hypothetical protein
LEDESARLMRQQAEQRLDVVAMKDLLSRKR